MRLLNKISKIINMFALPSSNELKLILNYLHIYIIYNK
jgi:hypothetical protein